MKSRKFNLIVVLLIVPLVLGACSKNIDAFKAPTKEGIQPYDLSHGEKYLLESFAMEGNSQIISFKAPKEAISLEVRAYRLGEDSNWDLLGSGGVSLGQERQPIDRLVGSFTMELRDNQVIEYNINTAGRASFRTDEIILDREERASMKVFLQEHQDIEIDKEIPVALMAYDGKTSMRTYALEDYFDPIKFQGLDLVQVVSLTFKGE